MGFAECHSVPSSLDRRAIPSRAAITLLAPMSQDAASNNIEGTGQRLCSNRFGPRLKGSDRWQILLVGPNRTASRIRVTGTRAHHPYGQLIWSVCNGALKFKAFGVDGTVGRGTEGACQLASTVMVLAVDGGRVRCQSLGVECSCRPRRGCVWRGCWSQSRERPSGRCDIVSSKGSGAPADACRSKRFNKACPWARFQ